MLPFLNVKGKISTTFNGMSTTFLEICYITTFSIHFLQSLPTLRGLEGRQNWEERPECNGAQKS